MTLLDEAKLREMFGLAPEVKAGLLTRSIGAASTRLKAWVGAATYASNDAAVKSDLELAEGYLAMHFAVIAVNTFVRPGGVVKTEKSESDVSLTYLTPAESRKLADEHLAAAEEIARPHMLSDGTPDGDFLVVEDEEE